MKIWGSFGSEHSMNLVMIGRFEEEADASKAKDLIDQLIDRVAAAERLGEIQVGQLHDRFGDNIRQFLYDAKLYSLGPAEMEQFAYDVKVEQEGKRVELRTDEIDVSAFLKVLLDCGARIEVFSAHVHSESGDTGKTQGR